MLLRSPNLFFVSLLIVFAVAQKDDGFEDYAPDLGSPENGPGSPTSGINNKDAKNESPGGEGDPANEKLPEEEEEHGRTKFSDERFAKLFPSRGAGRLVMPKHVAKPKPTLPSFIKSTPPLLKAQLNTTPQPRNRVRAAPTASTVARKSVSTSTTVRPRGRIGNQSVTPRPLSGRLSTSSSLSRSTVAPNSSNSTPSSGAAARRRANNISRFSRTNNVNNAANNLNNSNSTIPALNPRRN